MNALTHILRAIKAALFALLCLAVVIAGMFGKADKNHNP